jgi:ABC-2 type transport system permease protein
MLLFCAGISLMLSALAVFFRDLVYLWGVFILAWTYATPLFYPTDMLPDWMQRVMQFNPMYQYVTYFREIVLWGITPNLEQNLICLGMAVAMFVLGVLIFRKLQSRFILFV